MYKMITFINTKFELHATKQIIYNYIIFHKTQQKKMDAVVTIAFLTACIFSYTKFIIMHLIGKKYLNKINHFDLR